MRVNIMSEIFEHAIHSFIRERGGSALKKEIYAALGSDNDSKRMIDEKLRMMERFGLIVIDGEKVKIK